jgi:hypothetical protein
MSQKNILSLALTALGVGFLFPVLLGIAQKSAPTMFAAPVNPAAPTFVEQIKPKLVGGAVILACLWIISSVVPSESAVKVTV